MGVTDAVRDALPAGADEREWDAKTVVALAAVLVAAAAVRIRGLTRESLWMDEVYSLTYATERSTRWILTELPLEDPHPPLYYLLLRGWTAAFGPTKVATRSLSVVFGVASVALVFALGARLYDRETGLLGAVFLSLSGMHLYLSQDGRMYGLYLALAAASLYWYVRVVFDGERSRRTLAAYVLTTALLGYTHVFGLFVILAQNCHLALQALREERERAFDLLRDWVGLQGAVTVLLAPFLAVLGMRLLGYPPFDAASPSWIPMPTVGYLFDAVSRYVGNGWLWDVWSAVFAVVFVALATYALLRDLEPVDATTTGRLDGLLPSRRVTLLALVFLVPWLVPFLVSHAVEPIYRIKYTAPAMIGLFLMAARGIGLLRWTNVGAGRFAVAGVLVVLLLAAPVAVIHSTPQVPQWEAAVEDAEAVDENPHLVVHGGDVPERFHPVVYLADGDTTASAVPPDASVDSGGDLETAIGDRDAFWLVFSEWRTEPEQRSRVWTAVNGSSYSPTDRRSHFAVWSVRFER